MEVNFQTYLDDALKCVRKEENAMINERIEALRALMRREGMTAYVISSSDFHLSEYTGDYFKERQYMSGFTGSAGTLVVTADDAALWTDGRYFIQAERELQGSGIRLVRQGMKDVPKVEEFLEKLLKEGERVGFDGRMIDAKWGIDLEKKLSAKGAGICWEKNLIDEIWTDRPPLPDGKLWILEEKYTGASADKKIADLRAKMKEKSADAHILTSLEDIAWLLNLRGSDIENTPVFLSYLMLTEDEVSLYIDSDRLTDDISAYLADHQVTVRPYNALYADIAALDKDRTVMIDLNFVNYAIYKGLKAKTVTCDNPTLLAKAVKNDVEIKNLFESHIRDGVAFTKFMYWLKKNIGKIPMSEISASDYLENCRRAQEGFVDLSFTTISAYNANAAMMHYSATPETNAELLPEGLLLVDSGGHYLGGTTDITRTIVLGPISDEVRRHFTAVLRGMLGLQNARFLYGCTGINLDILAREPKWETDIDYLRGTGHAVCNLLSVHEPPNGYRCRIVPERNDSCVLEAGMVTTDEPGIYIEGSHGIRLENELLCRKGVENEYGQFMYFEPLTFAPIDLDGIDERALAEIDKQRLNSYHRLVYDTISPYLTEEEAAWLRVYTREI